MNRKYVFIAWGIGITPFRSIIKYMLDKNLKNNITLIYNSSNSNEFLFEDIFSKAENQFDLKIVYISDKEMNQQLLTQYIKDPMQAVYYLSGPQPVVEKFRDELLKINVENTHIKTDLFTGYEQVK